MEFNLESEIIGKIWYQLNQPYSPLGSDNNDTLNLILQKGWVYGEDMRHVLFETDSRAENLMRQTNNYDFICKTLNLNFVTIFEGPIKKVEDLLASRSLSIADFTQLLIGLERLGFSTMPQKFVDVLKPLLIGKKFLTNSEVSVLRYGLQHRKQDAMIMWEAGRQADNFTTSETSNGYHATALFEGDIAVGLRVDAPDRPYKRDLKGWIDFHLLLSRSLAAA